MTNEHLNYLSLSSTSFYCCSSSSSSSTTGGRAPDDERKPQPIPTFYVAAFTAHLIPSSPYQIANLGDNRPPLSTSPLLFYSTHDSVFHVPPCVYSNCANTERVPRMESRNVTAMRKLGTTKTRLKNRLQGKLENVSPSGKASSSSSHYYFSAKTNNKSNGTWIFGNRTFPISTASYASLKTGSIHIHPPT